MKIRRVLKGGSDRHRREILHNFPGHPHPDRGPPRVV